MRSSTLRTLVGGLLHVFRIVCILYTYKLTKFHISGLVHSERKHLSLIVSTSAEHPGKRQESGNWRVYNMNDIVTIWRELQQPPSQGTSHARRNHGLEISNGRHALSLNILMVYDKNLFFVLLILFSKAITERMHFSNRFLDHKEVSNFEYGIVDRQNRLTW